MDSMQLVQVTRGSIIESAHRGHIAVVDSKGELLFYAGNPEKIVFARSSMKPIQAIPVVETGAADRFKLDDADLSLCCASHSGEVMHTGRVHSILGRAGLEASHLQCGTHIPHWPDSYIQLMKEGKEVTPLYNNCSGKHTGMLVTAKHLHESVEDYYELSHPVQQRILSAVSEMTNYPAEKIEIGIDGCGVPVHGLPLKNIAFAYARMANPHLLSDDRKLSVRRITKSLIAAPEMVGGTERFCTDFMKAGNGRFFGKAGAEGVYCIGDLETGIGIAIKIEDGNGRAVYPAAVETLKQLNLLSSQQLEELKGYCQPKLVNARKESVGELIPDFQLIPVH
ncbi:L-asparaginase II [Peribacillus deserti]|uniref:L-asparaginase II n=1 Tax=Peribacillus deserti TaxID=673318 RepID=A0ABS2QN11_9BACI|nr:asparaginase [Peribacillus deserti]MBM7693863.1 L-asparaginase II [Peribacillus deserti]